MMNYDDENNTDDEKLIQIVYGNGHYQVIGNFMSLSYVLKAILWKFFELVTIWFLKRNSIKWTYLEYGIVFAPVLS